jgi:hypothetical protein
MVNRAMHMLQKQEINFIFYEYKQYKSQKLDSL